MSKKALKNNVMRVAVYYNNRDVRLTEMPRPKIGPGELLVKVQASGLCGTDVLEWYRVKKAPLVLGHEITGEISEIGEGLKKYRLGQRVFVSHHVPCNACRYCLAGNHTACETLHNTNYFPGGFAEYIRVPELNVDRGVFPLPPEISFEEGTFIEPLACVARALRLARLSAGQSVLVLGGGVSGILHVLMARALGAGRVIATDINDYRLSAVKRFGADVINGKEDVKKYLLSINENRLADLVIVCTGALPAFKQSIECVDRGGTVVFFASTDAGVSLPIPVDRFWRNSIKIMSSYGNSPYDATVAIELIRSGRIPVRKLITHRLSFKEIGKGFKLVSEAKDSLKVIIEPARAK